VSLSGETGIKKRKSNKLVMEYRTAVSGDIEVITSLFIEFKDELTQFQPDFVKPFRVDKKPVGEIRELIAEKISNPKGQFLAAEEGGEIRGFAYAAVEDFKSDVYPTHSRGIVDHVWVHPKVRNHGVGGELIDQTLAWLKKKNCPYARVVTVNKNPAKKLYKEKGFEDTLTIMLKKL